MNSTVTKVLAGLILFASGVVIGVFGARYLTERGRLALLHGDPRHFAEMLLHHLSADLDLTAAQQAKLRPILMHTADELSEIRREQEPKVRASIEKSHKSIVAILTPEQRVKFSALMDRLEKRRKAMERFGPPPPPPPGMGPPPPPPGDDFPPPPGDDFPPPPPPPPGGFPPPHGPGWEGKPGSDKPPVVPQAPEHEAAPGGTDGKTG